MIKEYFGIYFSHNNKVFNYMVKYGMDICKYGAASEYSSLLVVVPSYPKVLKYWDT